MKSRYSWRAGVETSGVAGNRSLLRQRKVTATRRLKADHSLTVKATKPKYSGTYRGKTKKGLNKRGNQRSDMVLYVLQTAFYRKLQSTLQHIQGNRGTVGQKQLV